MEDIKKLLELRSKIKDKKPDFIRQDYQRRKRLGRKLKWRKPKGIHSKIRHQFKGRRKLPSPGYKSPILVRNLHSSGLKPINIHSLKDLEKIYPQSEGIIVSKSVGMKKKLELLKKANELKLSVLNLNSSAQIRKIEDIINSKRKKDTKETKKEEAKDLIQSKETRQEPKENISDDQKKELEKKEKDKILTKRV